MFIVFKSNWNSLIKNSICLTLTTHGILFHKFNLFDSSKDFSYKHVLLTSRVKLSAGCVCVCACVRACVCVCVCSLVVTCWERTDLLALLYVMFSCTFVTFPYGVLGQVLN